MSLSRIVMRLARNPGTEFADGDDHRGYSLVAPLDADGHLDEAAFKTERDDCTVRLELVLRLRRRHGRR